MSAITKLYNRLKSVDVNSISQSVMSQRQVQEWLIETAQDRIYNTGIVSNGQELVTDNAARGEVYSFSTIESKAASNKRFRNVTLEDSGQFYKSWIVEAEKTYYQISAEFNKSDGNIYENFSKSFSNASSFESAVLGLTDDEISFFIGNIFYPRFLQIFKNIVCG